MRNGAQESLWRCFKLALGVVSPDVGQRYMFVHKIALYVKIAFGVALGVTCLYTK
jgi:hypothetical protein